MVLSGALENITLWVVVVALVAVRVIMSVLGAVPRPETVMSNVRLLANAPEIFSQPEGVPEVRVHLHLKSVSVLFGQAQKAVTVTFGEFASSEVTIGTE